MRIHEKQAGNILFLILLAVVLFAALAYAVTQSLRGGGKDGGSEKVTSQVSELHNFFTAVDTATQRMMLTNDIKDYQLSFTGGVHGTYGSNPDCTTNKCRIFHTDGGAVTPINNTAPFYKGTGSGGFRVFLMSIPGAGTDKADLAIVLYAVKTSICREINKQAGFEDIPFNTTFNESAVLQDPSDSGEFADTTQTLAVPSSYGSKGTFCACNGASLTSCEANGFYPVIFHVVEAR